MRRRPLNPDAAPFGRRLHEWPGPLFDLLTVGGLLLVGALLLVSTTHAKGILTEVRLPAYAVVAVGLGALLVRRTHPIVTWAVIVGAVVVEALLGSVGLVHPLILVATYTVAARLRWRLSLPLTIVAAMAFALSTGVERGGFGLTSVIAEAVATSAAYTVGLYARTRMDYIRA